MMHPFGMYGYPQDPPQEIPRVEKSFDAAYARAKKLCEAAKLEAFVIYMRTDGNYAFEVGKELPDLDIHINFLWEHHQIRPLAVAANIGSRWRRIE